MIPDVLGVLALLNQGIKLICGIGIFLRALYINMIGEPSVADFGTGFANREKFRRSVGIAETEILNRAFRAWGIGGFENLRI